MSVMYMAVKGLIKLKSITKEDDSSNSEDFINIRSGRPNWLPSEYPYFDYTAGLEGDARYGWADMYFYSVARKWYVNTEMKIRLADIVGYPHESKEPRVFDQPYPFKELFTMQEGQIYGPIVCKKLADDFNEWHGRIEAIGCLGEEDLYEWFCSYRAMANFTADDGAFWLRSS